MMSPTLPHRPRPAAHTPATHGSFVDAMLGDLAEEYAERAARDGSASEAVRKREVALQHFAYFPGTVYVAAAWKLLPNPFDDYRLLMLVCNLLFLPAALAFRGPLSVRLVLGALLACNPILVRSAWFGQNDELAGLEHQLGQLESVNADLQVEVDRLQTDAGIMEAAREELGLIKWGERRETVTNLPALPTDLPDGWPYGPVKQIIALRTTPP